MEGVTVRHWVETPVRYQEMFSAGDLDNCKLEHSFYALPGPHCLGLKNSLKEEEVEEKLCHEYKEDITLRIMLDVVQFRPEDIIIQVFEGWLIIKAEHGSRMDEHGFVSRSFTRTYKLPNGTESKDLTAVFCHDGILAVEIKK
ncbi:heat shock protein beta-3 [Bombina bombina]|uniref:heat shock protein beta-3 n=1 Tax=Bombina bombina TaxID=8345 RepID=UPI00235A4B64|nr:heat shock protein beta-3 [Bombina bombina]